MGTVAVKVWEYQGSTQNITNEQLIAAIERDAVLTVDLSLIEEKLNLIIDFLKIPKPEIPPTKDEQAFFFLQ